MYRIKQLILIVILNSLVYIANADCTDAERQQITTVFDLMAQRTVYLKDVARYKYFKHENIYDAKQEKIVLANSTLLAKQNNLNQLSLMIFVQIQMDLSKQIEQYWFSLWASDKSTVPNAKEVKNLTNIRNQIKKIDYTLIPAIKTAIPAFNSCSENTTTELFNKSFIQIKGIPAQPNYKELITYSIINIKEAH